MIESLHGARALVLGLGRFGGGLGSARFLARAGAEVRATDLSPAEELGEAPAALAELGIELVAGEHRARDVEWAELVLVNPAVPATSPWLARARAAGARLTSDVELYLERSRARVVGVTGTQGKSSTAHFAAQLAGGRALGNIGRSPLDELEAERAEDVRVLELSSYQLEHLEAPERLAGSLRAVAVTNVLADHLERHGSVEAYAEAKQRLLQLVDEQGSCLLPLRGGPAAGWRPPRGRVQRFDVSDPTAELHLADGRFRGRSPEGEAEDWGAASALAPPGAFQRANALVALGLARALGGAPAELAERLGCLEGLPHRLEDLGLLDGVRVWDNAVSTTPDSTRAALDALTGECTLLCGGRLKGLSLAPLTAAEGVARAVCFGEGATQLASAFESAGREAHVRAQLEPALALALSLTPRGGQLLFSPAAASFDAYQSFQQRAHAFRAALEHPAAPQH